MSHLDLMRCMTRAILRAEIPIKYTEGFNPHPYLVFAAPLALGIAGEHEYFEIRTMQPISPDEIRERLNRTLPTGLRILSAEETDADFNRIEQAVYRLEIEGKTKTEWDAFYSAEQIPAEKKTKRGIETVDLKAEIHSAEASDTPEGLRLELCLPCGNRKNLSPLLVMKTFCADPECYYTVTRMGLYDSEHHKF